MNKLRYTRFNNIYDSRASAIQKLDSTARYYAENVCIRYKDSNKKIQIMLALYRSTSRGDYNINFDSGNPSGGDPGTHVQRVKRLPGETDKECLGRIYFDREPDLFDVVIIISDDSDDDIYIWTGSIWISLNQNVTIYGDTTTTAATTSWIDDDGDYHIAVNIPLDGETLIVDLETGLIRVSIDDQSIVQDKNTGAIMVGTIDGGGL